MDAQLINKQLTTVNEALGWLKYVPKAEQLEYKKKLINYRRGLKKIQYAISEPCSSAAFGESQMGKSYLISAMLSSSNHPFAVTDGEKQYDFISEINPSRPNSTIEATGVITRFTTKAIITPTNYLKVRLLSVTDIVLILCEAYYNQVDYLLNEVLSKDEINEFVKNIIPEKPVNKQQIIGEDDVLDIKEYLLNSSTLSKKCDKVLNSDLFNFLVQNVYDLSKSQISSLLQILWNRQSEIGRLWADMMAAYEKLEYKPIVYTCFDSVLKRKGTLLDVARLDEMYGDPEDTGSEYEPMAEVKTEVDGKSINLEKSFFSSLIAELSFSLDEEMSDTHPFLKDLDILDFPGARRPEQIKQDKLGEGKNLSTVLRRGKVAYLFNKYSAAKRISSLLFCHNNSMSGESSMGGLLDKWVTENIGADPRRREEYIKTSVIPPLFVISTWFNKDLEYQDETAGDTYSLDARWNRRFNVVLEKEVLKSLGDDKHWFNDWSVSTKQFQNIYMLRDFKYSKTIYNGYDPRAGHPESGEPVRPANYPTFFSDLKKSFISNDFVQLHFSDPNEAWESAASCAKDGTLRIINSLNTLAPNVSHAREDKFDNDIKQIRNGMSSFLEQYYHPDTNEEQLNLAKRQAGRACVQIDRMIGRDAYAFGKFLDTMMISEPEIYELINSLILGEEQPMPMNDEEAQIFMAAGMDTSLSRDENLDRLCAYLGVNDEDECRSELGSIDLDKLLSKSQMMVSRADNIVASVEGLWHDKVLMTRVVNSYENTLPAVSTIMSSLWSLYKMMDVRQAFIEKVNDYISNIDKSVSVGIISDYLSIQFNDFASSFGFKFLKDSDKQKLFKKNAELKLNIDTSLIDNDGSTENINLLSDLNKLKEMLSGKSFVAGDRKFLARFPQYKKVWRWQQQLRCGYILASELPDYDINANSELKAILENINS